MKAFFLIVNLLGLPFCLTAQHKGVSLFDPATDAVASLEADTWKLQKTEKILTESVQATTPELKAVTEVRVQKIGNYSYIIFKGQHRDSTDCAFSVAVRLKETSPGVFSADSHVQTCTGNPCNSCGFNNGGCVCNSYNNPNDPLNTGNCNNSVSSRMAFKPLVAKE